MKVDELRQRMDYVDDDVVILIEDPHNFRARYRIRSANMEERGKVTCLLLTPLQPPIREED